MKYLLDQQDLLRHLEVPDFVLKTQQQIHKDFSMQGLEISDELNDSELTYDGIHSIVSSGLEGVMRQGESILLQLNYQIDIPQQQFLDAITSENPITQLAELIIRREAYKVYLRTKF